MRCLKGSFTTIFFYPIVFACCCGALTAHEIYLANETCHPSGIMQEDHRWILRSAEAFVMPLLFALAIDSWVFVGDLLRLSWDLNEQQPPTHPQQSTGRRRRKRSRNDDFDVDFDEDDDRHEQHHHQQHHNGGGRPIFCRYEAMFPSLFVGESFLFFIVAGCWIYCTPKNAFLSFCIGLFFVVLGFGLSLYLRRQKLLRSKRPSNKEKKTKQTISLAITSAAAGGGTCDEDDDEADEIIELEEGVLDVDICRTPSYDINSEIHCKGRSLGAYDLPID